MSQPLLIPRLRADEGIVMSSQPEHSVDEEIMRAYLAGDQQVFSRLFRAYAPLLAGYFMRRGHRAHDVADLVQQTFLQFHRARHEYRVGEAVRPWLYTIARNVGCDQHRRRQRRPETYCDPDTHEATHAQGPEPTQAERARALSSLLERVPPATRTLLTEHWLEERNWNQIADRAGVSATALRVRAHRACAELRRWFEHSQFEFA